MAGAPPDVVGRAAVQPERLVTEARLTAPQRRSRRRPCLFWKQVSNMPGRLVPRAPHGRDSLSPTRSDGLPMKHTNHADYALRVLLYLRVAPGRRGSIAEIAQAHRISRNHLDKVVQRMASADLVATSRGRGGGVRLVRDPTTITVGDVIRAMEDDFAVVECLGPARFCRVAGVCGARSVFAKALESYFAVLDGATLDDVAANDDGLRGALELIRQPVAPVLP